MTRRSGVYIFNLGTGTGATVLEVIKAFSEVVGKDIPHVIAGRRKGDVDSLYASCDLAHQVICTFRTQMIVSNCLIDYIIRDEAN